MKINKNSISRFLLISISALVILLMYLMVSEINSQRVLNHLPAFLIGYIIIFNVASEGNVCIDKYFDKKMPWFTHSRSRLIRQIPLSLIWTFIFTAFSIYLVRYIIFKEFPNQVPRFALFAFIQGSIFLITLNGVMLAINFFNNWKSSYQNIEELQKEKLKSDYKLLQDQVNPHFLFNSFNVLISEINHDPKIATEFTRKLSQVYRYVLQSKNHDIITLKEELKFIRSFVYLHQIRIGDSLKCNIDVNDDCMEFLLPPLTLQILVENVIKHNTVNDENRLYINIQSIEDNKILVENNLNPKTIIESTQTGLNNIKNRYKLLGDYTIEIDKTETHFRVKVPLIDE